mgnify:CR=1 FL=1
MAAQPERPVAAEPEHGTAVLVAKPGGGGGAETKPASKPGGGGAAAKPAGSGKAKPASKPASKQGGGGANNVGGRQPSKGGGGGSAFSGGSGSSAKAASSRGGSSMKGGGGKKAEAEDVDEQTKNIKTKNYELIKTPFLLSVLTASEFSCADLTAAPPARTDAAPVSDSETKAIQHAERGGG